jgi:BTB/POZ domain-containing protein 17
MNPQWKETNESTIYLYEEKKAAEFFNLFLKYLYTGQVRVKVESAMPLLSLADKYNVKDLIIVSRDYMLKNVALASTRGFLISWLQYSLTSNTHLQLSNELKNFLCLNLEIVSLADFIEIDPNNLVLLLQQNDLVVESESKLFDIIERWMMMKREQIEQEESLPDEEKQSHMRSLIEGICGFIRFPMMTFQELAAIPLRPIVSLNKEFFMDRVALGFSFHANHPLPCDPDYIQFTPRLYTSGFF